MPPDRQPTRVWKVDELRVLVAIFFNASFSIGDDARDECRAIADCFGRTPSSIDRQWRNVSAVVRGLPGYNIGGQVRAAVAEYLADPMGAKRLALHISDREAWPLRSLIERGTGGPFITTRSESAVADVRDEFRRLAYGLQFKLFASGSQGFYCQRKLAFLGGERYQAQVSAVLVGSKRNPSLAVQASNEEVAYGISPVLDRLEAKTFRTGRTGYYANGKVRIGSETYQVSVQAVRIADK